MNFFKKNGRTSEEEMMLIESIQKMAEQKGIPMDEIPECHSLEDLIEVRQLLDNQTNDDEQDEVNESENHEEQLEQHTQEEGVEEEIQNELQEIDNQSDSEEEEESQKANDHVFIAKNYDPFSDPIIERSYTGNQANQTPKDESEEDELQLEDSKIQTPLQDLNPATKRRAAEQTANIILKSYAKIVPEPFKVMSKFNEEKVEKMTMNGEIDISLEVSEGLSFDDYMRQTNKEIDEVFEVQEDTLEEIKEPLIDVLLEQQLELTPTQRLTMAVLSHLAQMFTVALKLRNQNNRILSYQRYITHLAKTKVA